MITKQRSRPINLVGPHILLETLTLGAYPAYVLGGDMLALSRLSCQCQGLRPGLGA